MGRLAGVAARRMVGDNLHRRVSGQVDWEQKSYTVTGSGPNTLKWRYVKDASNSSGYDCGWVDYVQWSGVLDGKGKGSGKGVRLWI